MDLALFHHESSLSLITAFEDGSVSVHYQEENGSWVMTYRSQPHSQPILSLDIHPSREYFLTSAADSLIVKHPIPTTRQEVPAVLDPQNRIIEEVDDGSNPTPSLLSAALRSDPAKHSGSVNSTFKEWEHPLKTINTKHSGQQNLKIRSDGKIFATAGWDSNIRVYSAKTLKELAVLQWHKVGCYAVAFPDIAAADSQASAGTGTSDHLATSKDATGAGVVDGRRSTALVSSHGMSVKDRRMMQAKSTHWIAAGAKDGKISLWDIY